MNKLPLSPTHNDRHHKLWKPIARLLPVQLVCSFTDNFQSINFWIHVHIICIWQWHFPLMYILIIDCKREMWKINLFDICVNVHQNINVFYSTCWGFSYTVWKAFMKIHDVWLKFIRLLSFKSFVEGNFIFTLSLFFILFHWELKLRL